MNLTAENAGSAKEAAEQIRTRTGGTFSAIFAFFAVIFLPAAIHSLALAATPEF